VNLLALLSLLPGCGPKKPAGPGISEPLQFPVLLVGQRRVVVKPDVEKLTTTTIATSLNFPEFALIDSAGRPFVISQVTAFDRMSGLLDMATSSFQVFLHLKPAGQPTLGQLKSLVKQTAIAPEAEAREVDEAASLPQLIERCSTSWRW
jgi:hypothetical protein